MSTLVEQLPSMVRDLLRPEAYPHSCSEIELVETHISWVLLTGDYAYKIKKPVNFGFLDFSTLEKRHFYCAEELRLNRRTAPQTYLSVVALTESTQGLRVGGESSPVEYAVKMRQFDQTQLLDRQLEQGRLTPQKIDLLAKRTARFHSEIAVAQAEDSFGTPEHITSWAMENFEQLEKLIEKPYRRERIARLKSWTEEQQRKLHELMLERKERGFVRECHGDLHLRNVTEIEGAIVPFDGIEFNSDIRWIDVLNELAFLYTDLEHRQRADLGWRALNAYLEQTGDYEALRLFAYYRLYRIMVRAKVDSLRLTQVGLDAQEREELESDIDIYLEQGEETIKRGQAPIVLMRGLSGSGKTTLSQKLLEQVGMIRIRSDVERKRLFHLSPEAETHSPVGGGLYSQEISTKTFARLLELCRQITLAGLPTIVDATFLRQPLVESFRQLARELGRPFRVLDLQAPESVLRERIENRRHGDGQVSEATQDVLSAQLKNYEPLDEPHALAVDAVAPPSADELAKFIETP